MKNKVLTLDTVIFVFALGAMGASILIQHIGIFGVRYLPCPLCIMQRTVLLACLTTAGIVLLLNKHQSWFRLGTLLFAITGIGLAVRQLVILRKPAMSCGIDPIERFINEWLLNSYSAWFFRVESNCHDNLAPLFGLSIPIWSLTVFTGIGLLTIFQIVRIRFSLRWS